MKPEDVTDFVTRQFPFDLSALGAGSARGGTFVVGELPIPDMPGVIVRLTVEHYHSNDQHFLKHFKVNVARQSGCDLPHPTTICYTLKIAANEITIAANDNEMELGSEDNDLHRYKHLRNYKGRAYQVPVDKSLGEIEALLGTTDVSVVITLAMPNEYHIMMKNQAERAEQEKEKSGYLRKKLNEQRKAGEKTDAVIKGSEGRGLPVHLAILDCEGERGSREGGSLPNLFDSEGELEIPDVEEGVLDVLLDFIYTKELPEDDKTFKEVCQNLISVSDRYVIPGMEHALLQRMMPMLDNKADELDVALDLLQLSYPTVDGFINLSQLKMAAMARICTMIDADSGLVKRIRSVVDPELFGELFECYLDRQKEKRPRLD